jgi:two-component system, cell cycle response regulator
MQSKVLSHLLTRAGHELLAVASGTEALEHLVRGGFNLLITDWDMPGMDGATLCRKVRSAQLPDYIYILMLTGHTTEADLLGAFDAGADDYVRKPASAPELLARVRAGCRLLELEGSLRVALAQVRELSITDALTSVYNRRYLDDQLERELARSRRFGRPVGLVLADVDHFKQVNDEWGHAAGDEVLRCVARRLQGEIRNSTDWVARYGGEEFAVVLPETSLEQAAFVAEKLRAACADTPVTTVTGRTRAITASFGVAGFAGNASTISANDLLRAADAALYRSKRAGRNRASIAP